MGIKLAAASGGSVELVPTNTASNFTVTVPAATTTMVGTDTAQTLTNKTLTTPSFDSAQVATVSGTAPLYMCRAWVNFNGTGTVAIRASGNVSSITDNGTGDYTVNFTTAMPDTAYCPATQSVGESTTSLRGGSMIMGTWAGGATLKTTTQLRIYTGYTFTTAGGIDSAEVNVAIFR